MLSMIRLNDTDNRQVGFSAQKISQKEATEESGRPCKQNFQKIRGIGGSAHR